MPFYSAMDVFCFPSLWEGLPLTLVEAQYNGLPCIVSKAVTKEAVLTDKVDFVPLHDIKHWCEKIEASNARANRAELQIISDLFDIRICYKKLESIYQS